MTVILYRHLNQNCKLNQQKNITNYIIQTYGHYRPSNNRFKAVTLIKYIDNISLRKQRLLGSRNAS